MTCLLSLLPSLQGFLQSVISLSWWRSRVLADCSPTHYTQSLLRYLRLRPSASFIFCFNFSFDFFVRFLDCGVMSCRRGAVGIWGLYQEEELADWGSLWEGGSGESLLNWSWRGVSEWDGGRESIALDCKTASKSLVNEEEDWPQKKAWVV